MQEAWEHLPSHFPPVQLDEIVLMPDHVHCIIVLLDASASAAQGAPRRAPTLADTVRALKGNAPRRINQLRETPGAAVWQRNYYEHIVRNEDELARIREYIINNPLGEHSHAVDDVADAWLQRRRAGS